MLKSKLKLLSFTLAASLICTGLPISKTFQTSPIIAYAAESSVATASISEILANQQADGGWRKNYKTTSGDWSKSTIDNDATYTEIRKLAAEYSKNKDSKYSSAVIKGINFLLNMQYDNGGWPQIYKGTGYHAAITFNDNAMINVMYLLDEIANKKGDFSFIDNALAKKCAASVEKGVQCILNCQVVSNGKLTAWGQQHDKDTLKPTSARAYELPSLCSQESAPIVKFLKTRPATPQITNAIKAATQWFDSVKITGIKVVKKNGDVQIVKDSSITTPMWARFYELETNKPLFCGRDGIAKYQLSDIEKERRTGYSWYNTSGKAIISDTKYLTGEVSNKPNSSLNNSGNAGSTDDKKEDVSTETTTSTGLKLDYSVNDWGSAYQVTFKVINSSKSHIQKWTLKLKKSEINITTSWNVNIKEDGDYYVITPVEWNSAISAGNSIEFGIHGSGDVSSKLNYILN